MINRADSWGIAGGSAYFVEFVQLWLALFGGKKICSGG